MSSCPELVSGYFRILNDAMWEIPKQVRDDTVRLRMTCHFDSFAIVAVSISPASL